MMIVARDGTRITQMGSQICCSNGATYTLMGTVLVGPLGFKSYGVKSMSEAVGIVIGMHGGRKF